MGDVFANGLEISGKAVQAQTIAAFPDVCMTPPESPATPPGVPIPYPNFALAGDTENGTSTVKIKGKTVNIKNKSDMKKTSGDEAGCAAKKGVITSKNMGKSYFNSWSPNVKFEGEPVVRMSDLTTNNHASPGGNTPPWLHVAKAAPGWNSDCEQVYLDYMTTYAAGECAEGHQAHHIVDNSSFTRVGARDDTKEAYVGSDSMGTEWKKLKNLFQEGSDHPGAGYHEDDAPCICLEDGQKKGKQHKKVHDLVRKARKKSPKSETRKTWTYGEARDAGAEACQKVLDLSDVETECIKLMLDSYYKGDEESGIGCTDSTEIRASGKKSLGTSEMDIGNGTMAPISPAPPMV